MQRLKSLYSIMSFQTKLIFRITLKVLLNTHFQTKLKFRITVNVLLNTPFQTKLKFRITLKCSPKINHHDISRFLSVYHAGPTTVHGSI